MESFSMICNTSDLRPMVHYRRFATSDLNDLYKEL